jgi:hypothetical protein
VPLSRTEIVQAFEALGGEISTARVELVVVGGAELVLLYQARESTKDVDAFSLTSDSDSAVKAAARRVADRLDLPEDWLNDAAKGYVRGLSLGPVLIETPSVVVRTLAPEQLLAMKLAAWRDDVDVDDARLLISKLPGDRDLVWSRIEPHLLPGRELKARYAFDDLWEERRGRS